MLKEDVPTWNIAATRFIQGGRIQYLLSIPMSQLRRFLALDNYVSVMSRSQRELKRYRVKKIVNYLIKSFDNKTPYFIPPLIANIDRDMNGDTNIGILKVPMDSIITLFDDQHRANAIIEFCKERVVHDWISIKLTENLDLQTRQQFFSDINSNASKTSAAINLAYNNREDYSHLTRYWIGKVKSISDYVDYENNVVPSKSSKLVSFKALYDATKRILGECTETVLSETTKYQSTKIWEAWTYLIGLTEEYCTVRSLNYRKEHITLHAVLINAFSFAVCEMMRETKDIVAKLNRVSCIIDETKRDEFFRIENWKSICVDPERGTIRADLKSKRSAGSHLLNFINEVLVDN
ncbi:DGQHR domain-containing protein [Xenorhabdus nematophila]|uniref:DGQHR domain-containing protein n=1 Tax=Xenorhabdus nematophila TaxID=628 RepID=UPI0032B8431A